MGSGGLGAEPSPEIRFLTEDANLKAGETEAQTVGAEVPPGAPSPRQSGVLLAVPRSVSIKVDPTELHGIPRSSAVRAPGPQL